MRYLVEQEWAETAEDVLWRRSKLGLRPRAEERIAIDQFIVSARPRIEPRPAAAWLTAVNAPRNLHYGILFEYGISVI